MELQQKTKEKDECIQKLRDEIDELKGAKKQKLKETDNRQC